MAQDDLNKVNSSYLDAISKMASYASSILAKSMESGGTYYNNIDSLINDVLNGSIKDEDKNNTNTDKNNTNTDNANTNTEEDAEIFEEPVNYTDPIVRHDPELEKQTVIRKYQPQFEHYEGESIGANEDRDMTKVDGILYPIILLNNNIIEFDDIVMLKILYTDFMPSLTLKIHYKDDIMRNDVPTLNNIVTVVIVPEFEGAYKSISIDFYIERFFLDSFGNMTYICKYKLLDLDNHVNKSIIFGGCHDKYCTNNTSEQKKLNTFECMHEIAKDLKLGFAATDHCDNIEDRLPRVLYSETYTEFIRNQIAFGGLDEDSIFDCWIDLYRYLVLVNVSWVFNQIDTMNPHKLSINAIIGEHGTDIGTVKSKCVLSNRVLTNFSQAGITSNMTFYDDDFYEETNNDLRRNGINQTVISLPLAGCVPGANNSLSTTNVLAQESSVSGQHLEDYESSKMSQTTIQVDPINTNLQRVIRKSYLEKKRAKIYYVTLRRINHGLQRGTLVCIAFFTTDPIRKRLIMTSSSRLVGDTSTEPDKVETSNNSDKTKEEIIMREDFPILDPSLSGLYYIDGMVFEYDYEDEEMLQTLNLIKVGNISDFNDKYSAPKIKTT